MVTIALIGPSLPPGVAFVCGMVVYCEFIVQPIALLLVSPKLRMEVSFVAIVTLLQLLLLITNKFTQLTGSPNGTKHDPPPSNL